ncbi:hypothetical protein FRZ67_02405 [Panacibacter ginsenosidivorans]|uniref:Nuclear transport factor 2 family protein n=1 Tax=Panacibacter ginsenosidivorans TaxID=1813871 RepID=A0A5B8V4T3_9BACT|nr:hypothetical protein [Panacibacter ginsenosidivorans]QEC66212.1 hypothetical protein FRZ67_02405 [Panacibacter ginsenosidivorans]
MRLLSKYNLLVTFILLSIGSHGQSKNINDTISIYKAVLLDFEGKNNAFVIYEKSSSAIKKESLNNAVKNNKICFLNFFDNDTISTDTELDASWSIVIEGLREAKLEKVAIPNIKGLDITFISDSDIEKMDNDVDGIKDDRKDINAFWKSFYKKFPKAIGLLSLSTIFFNEEKNKAIVHDTIISGFRSGGSSYSFLDNKNGSWKMIYVYSEMVF